MEQDPKSQSKFILNELGKSFAAAFSLDGQINDDSIDALLDSLDAINISREVVLEEANAQLTTLLSSSANSAQ